MCIKNESMLSNNNKHQYKSSYVAIRWQCCRICLQLSVMLNVSSVRKTKTTKVLRNPPNCSLWLVCSNMMPKNVNILCPSQKKNSKNMCLKNLPCKKKKKSHFIYTCFFCVFFTHIFPFWMINLRTDVLMHEIIHMPTKQWERRNNDVLQQWSCGPTHPNPCVTGTDLQKMNIVWHINHFLITFYYVRSV